MDYQFEEEEESFWSKFSKGFIELIEFVAIAGAVLVTAHLLVAEPHQVSGNSMVPNFHNGDYILTNKLAARFSTFQRGEVIILKSPQDSNKVFIKRIIALPNESVRIQSGRVYVNGQPLPESYLPPGVITEDGTFIGEGEEIIIPQGQYFVLGDNRPASSDSREFGPIRKETIVGQAWLRYWPIQKIGIIPINIASN